MANVAQLALGAHIYRVPSDPDSPRAHPFLECAHSASSPTSSSPVHLPRAANIMAPKKKEIGYMNKYIYDAFLWTFSVLVELFFREVHPRGSWKVPKEGPVLFVCAPHANQVS